MTLRDEYALRPFKGVAGRTPAATRARVLPDWHADAGSSIVQTIVAIASMAVVLKGLDSLGVVNFMNVDNLLRLVGRSAGQAENKVSHLVTTAAGDSLATVLSITAVILITSLVTVMLVSSSRTRKPVTREHAQLHARKGALVAFNKLIKYLDTAYAVPGSQADPVTNYDTTGSPVTFRGRPVVLSALSGLTPNHPAAGVQAAFEKMGQGTLTVDGSPVEYSTAATLLAMRHERSFDAVEPAFVQSWRLMARGAVLGAGQSTMEVSTEYGRQVIPAFKYGLFATEDSCGALELSGGVSVNSYDSSNVTRVSGLPKSDDWGGHVGTNGNLADLGGSTIFGSLSTPRRGVGSCLEGPINGIDAERPNPVTGSLIELSELVTLDPPLPPSPMPPTTPLVISHTCTHADLPLASGSRKVAYPRPGETVVTLDPQGRTMVLGNVHVMAGTVLVLEAGIYHINSIALSGQSMLRIGSGPVILNVAGVNQASPVNFEGGTVFNGSFDSSDFRILYAGTGLLQLSGGSTLVASVYAPNADVRITGGARCFGGVVAGRISISGGGTFHYDRRLHDCVLVGPPVMSALTWKEY